MLVRIGEAGVIPERYRHCDRFILQSDDQRRLLRQADVLSATEDIRQ